MPDPLPTRSVPVPLLDRADLSPVRRLQIGEAATWLLIVGLAAIVVLGGLAIWHLVRRGRLIRERLGPPRIIDLRASCPETDPSPDA